MQAEIVYLVVLAVLGVGGIMAVINKRKQLLTETEKVD